MKFKKLTSLAAVVLAVAMLSVVAFADPVASVEATGAELISASDQNGILPDGALIITPYSQRASARFAFIQTELQTAYQQIHDATTLDELTSDVAVILAQYYPNLSVSNLVVADLFDVDPSEGYDIALPVTISVKTDAPSSNFVMLLQFKQDGTWEVIDPANATLSADGILTVSIDSYGPLAVVVQSSASSGGSTDTGTSTGESGTTGETGTTSGESGTTGGTGTTSGGSGTSPRTGETISMAAMTVVAVLVCAAGVFIVAAKRKAN